MALNVRVPRLPRHRAPRHRDAQAGAGASRSLAVGAAVVSADDAEIERAWQAWSDLFVLPQIGTKRRRARAGAAAAAAQRHPHPRPKFLVRRKPERGAMPTVHRGGRDHRAELIGRISLCRHLRCRSAAEASKGDRFHDPHPSNSPKNGSHLRMRPDSS